MNEYILAEAIALCVIFFFIIFAFVHSDRRGGLQWYPKEVQVSAVDRGIITQRQLDKQSKISKIAMLIASAVVILGSAFCINKASEWKDAFLQIYFLCFVMNWFDAIVVDYIWVKKTKYWIIPELADLEIAKPLSYLIRERVIMSFVYILMAALFACVVWI